MRGTRNRSPANPRKSIDTGEWMGTLASELAPVAARRPEPRVYADANIPNGVVSYMRVRLGWDVLFVLEHDDLRRARDIEHYRLARQLARTLVTLDRDYEDDRRFPPGEGAGVIVCSAPDEARLCRLLLRIDRDLFRADGAAPLPLEGRKSRVFIDGLGGESGA
jgi:hypothetical protein